MSHANHAACALVLTIALVPALQAAPAWAAAGDGDTLGVRLELGATTDVTNELYYEDAFIDTTFLGRRQISTPETRVSGVALAMLTGTRRGRAARFSLTNELRIGDKLQRNALQLSWIDDLAPVWRLSLNPRIEYRNDQTFDRDLQEWRGSLSGRVRRTFDDGNTLADFRARGDFLRTSGTGADFIPDRNVVQLGAGIDHAPLFGNEWRIGYRVDGRQFPDSTVRDHLEHGFDGRFKWSHTAGHWVSLDGTLSRRVTMDVAPTSRDNFWQEWSQAELSFRLSDAWQVRSRVEAEGFQYELQDSIIYFNYQVVRARLGPRFDRYSGFSFTGGPEAEVLRSGINPEENYEEIGGFLEAEFLRQGGWWSFGPAAGWREYSGTSLDPDGLGLRGSYAFYEISVLGDQRLPAGLRLRTFGVARIERHANPVNNATSLYFSLDVRRLF
jgi:hypothetical protein